MLSARNEAAPRQKNFKIIIVVPNGTATNHAIFLFGFYIAEDQLISIFECPPLHASQHHLADPNLSKFPGETRSQTVQRESKTTQQPKTKPDDALGAAKRYEVLARTENALTRLVMLGRISSPRCTKEMAGR